MFLCDKCHTKSGYTCFHMAMSLGRCEDCGEIRSCADCTAYKSAAAREPNKPCGSPTRSTKSRAKYGEPQWVKPIPDLPVKVPRAPAPSPPWDPESLRDQYPDELSESFGRKLIEDAAEADGRHPPHFGAK